LYSEFNIESRSACQAKKRAVVSGTVPAAPDPIASGFLGHSSKNFQAIATCKQPPHAFSLKVQPEIAD
jgi:hypothetical protein